MFNFIFFSGNDSKAEPLHNYNILKSLRSPENSLFNTPFKASSKKDSMFATWDSWRSVRPSAFVSKGTQPRSDWSGLWWCSRTNVIAIISFQSPLANQGTCCWKHRWRQWNIRWAEDFFFFPHVLWILVIYCCCVSTIVCFNSLLATTEFYFGGIRGLSKKPSPQKLLIFLGMQLTNGKDHQQHISHGCLGSKNITWKTCTGKTLPNITAAH